MADMPDIHSVAILAEPPVVQVAPDGGWFERDGVVTSLLRRRPLARLVAALLAAGDAGLSAASLIEAGWPGERILQKAARIRLRVAISTLRGMGLAHALTTTKSGYALCASTRTRPSEVVPRLERDSSTVLTSDEVAKAG